MMEWIPAIDLKDGAVVRLEQGRMDKAKVYSRDPVEMARRWMSEGATRLHLVDLNGACAGEPLNLSVIEKIAALDSRVKVQVGGGIRTEATLRRYLDAGVAYVILGTVAVKDRALTRQLLDVFKGKIILGIDAKNGSVATEGWVEGSALSAATVANDYAASAPVAIIYTDIGRDGMLTGPNLEASRALAAACPIPVIVSGGISSLEDLKAIRALKESSVGSGAGICGAILGKALYEGRFTLRDALKI